MREQCKKIESKIRDSDSEREEEDPKHQPWEYANTNTNTNYNSVRLVRASILRDVVHGSFRFFFIL